MGGTSEGWGCPGGQKKIFFKHVHVAYQIEGDEEQNRMQVKFHPRVKLVSLGEVKRSNIIRFLLPCQFQRFLYQILCVFSQIKDRKHIEQNFHSVARVMPRGAGGQKL